MRPRALDSDEFEALLRQLGSDREQAGHAYEELRRRLVTVFAYRGCVAPDVLADETLDRVARKVSEAASADWRDLRPFVFGVAWNVARESFRTMRTVSVDELDPADTRRPGTSIAVERRHACLDSCLTRLRSDERRLVLDYFQADRQEKIAIRSAMATRLRITPNALRIRVHRVTATLAACMRQCLELAMSDGLDRA
jgi:DNA-directed RNA polymerase specialized sigma24 family protein